MRKAITRYLIPRPDNDYKPHALRMKSLLVMAALVLCIEGFFVLNAFFFNTAVFRNLASVLPGVLVSLTNENREDNSLAPLSHNALLEQAAQLKANDMAAKGYFAHTSPEGHEPWYWLHQVGYNYSYAGENLAVNFVDSQDVDRAWMNSPLHRANIVNEHYTEVGIAVAQGVYKGRQAIFVAQFFGAPKRVSRSVALQTPASTPTPAPAGTPTSPVQQIPSVAEAPAPEVPTSQDAVRVLGSETSQPDQTSILRRVQSTPRATTEYVLGAFLLFVLLALTLTVFVKIQIQHPRIIAGAVAMVVLIAGLMYANVYITHTRSELPTDLTASVISGL